MAEAENVITRTTDFIRWFLPKVGKMPRDFKFLFGDRIIRLQLDLLEQLIEAYYSPQGSADKLRCLTAANLGIEKQRQMMRISTDMRWLSPQQFEFATRELSAIGGMVGGWMRQSKRGGKAPAAEGE
jgi:hypothetical protein